MRVLSLAISLSLALSLGACAEDSSPEELAQASDELFRAPTVKEGAVLKGDRWISKLDNPTMIGSLPLKSWESTDREGILLL